MENEKRLIERPQEESFYVKYADAMRDKVIELLEAELYGHRSGNGERRTDEA